MKTASVTVGRSPGHHAEPSARDWVGSTHNRPSLSGLILVQQPLHVSKMELGGEGVL